MPRISTPLMFQNSLNALLDQQTRLSETQLKISSGKRVETPADDPVGSSRLLNLKQQKEDTQQLQSNIDTALNDLSNEEVYLHNMQRQISSAKQLALRANNDTLTSQDRQSIKTELENILKSMTDIANARPNGQYIFAGAKTQTKPVDLDLNGNYVYLGDEIQRQIQVGSSIFIEANDTAKSAFFQVATHDINVSQSSGEASVTSAATALANAGSLNAITNGALHVNGISLDAAVSDGVSTTDSTASAIATAAAINAYSDKHNVIASVNATQFDFAGGTYTTNALAAGDFTINGVQIIGSPVSTDAAGLAALINNVGGTGVPGVTASDNGGQLRLTASDGRNIQLQTDGVTASGANFANFNLNGALALDQVQRGTVTLSDHQAITIAGSQPANVGFVANTYNVTANAGTAMLGNLYFVEKPPSTANNNEVYLIKFDNPPTTFQVFKESDPTTPMTGFKTYSQGQNLSDAVQVTTSPVTYTAGDTLVVEGMHFTLSGTPSANDSFTIALEPVESRDIFTAVQNLIDSVSQYGTQPSRRDYNIGLAVINLDNSLERVSVIRSNVGARMQVSENQQKTNDEFIFLATKGISAIEDLDITSAISQLVQQKLSFEAAQRSLVQIQRLSLFDFL